MLYSIKYLFKCLCMHLSMSLLSLHNRKKIVWAWHAILFMNWNNVGASKDDECLERKDKFSSSVNGTAA